MPVILQDELNYGITQELNRPVVIPTPKPKGLFLKQKERIVSARSMTPTMIICVDCAGNDPLPRKTYLTAAGCCEGCGGQSYMFASIPRPSQKAKTQRVSLNDVFTLAMQAGLITVSKDMSAYRRWLMEVFEVRSVLSLTSEELVYAASELSAMKDQRK